MKLLGVTGNQLLLAQQGLNTEFSKREFQSGSLEERIRALRRNIVTEITILSPYILSLESLATRYYDDSELALAAKELGYFNLYKQGYEKANKIVHHSYRCLPDVI